MKLTEPRNQEEIVKRELPDRLVRDERLPYPGGKDLHLKPRAEVGKVLADLVTSRPNLKELRWVVGDGFYVTYERLSSYSA